MNPNQIQLPPNKGEAQPIKPESFAKNTVVSVPQSIPKKELNESYMTDAHLLTLSQLSEKYGTDLNIETIQNSKGLTSKKADELFHLYGKNALTPPKEMPEILKFLSHLLNFLNLLLFGAGILSLVIYITDTTQPINLWLALFLLILVFFNMSVTYLLERSSSNVMKQFKKMLPPKCKVIRDGHEDEKKAESLVAGDLVKINGGDRIPADIRVILSRGLKVEQSALNGESEEIEIGSESQSNELMDSRNIIFNGCFCLEGSAMGVVINTGDRTFLGLVAAQTTRTKGEETKFQQEIKGFVRFVFILGIIMAIIVYAIGISQGGNPAKLFINAFIVVIIANVPEGLPATVTSCLTIVAKRMAKKQVFIKKLESVEALGSASVIASDKTGTLTQNKMSVEHLWFDGNIYTADYIRKFKSDVFKGNQTWKNILKVACLCNKAFFKNVEEEKESPNHPLPIQQKEIPADEIKTIAKVNVAIDIKEKKDIELIRQNSKVLVNSYRQGSGSFKTEIMIYGEGTNQNRPSFIEAQNEAMLAQIKETNFEEERKLVEAKNRRKAWRVIGDASEAALLRFGEDFKNTDIYRAKYEKIFEVPFNSKNKYQLSIHELFEKQFVVMKGAPEMIIKRCSHYLKHNKECEMSPELMASFQKAYEILGSKGERVLGAAYCNLGPSKNIKYSIAEHNYKDEGLVFLGLFALMDPPKKNVDDAIATARKAGIRVMMLTGDHPLTAEAIARTVGIIRDHKTKNEVAKKKKIPVEDVDENEALAAVIYGPDLLKYTLDDWNKVLLGKKEIVFSRISPQQKVEIVQHLQRLKEIVIVTGDGVNDAIALKKADIGVAMGDGGSDVAREAADVVFMDGNFASIIKGIEEGRKLYDNVKKSLVYTVSHLIVEVVPVVLNIAFLMPLGLTSLQILSIDLGTELGPAIAMAYEYSEDDIMDRPPRNTKVDKLSSKVTLSYAYLQASWIETCFALIAYFAVFWKYGIHGNELAGIADNNFTDSANNDWVSREGTHFSSDEQNLILHECQTAYYVTLVMSQFIHIWFCRTRQKSLFSHGFRNAVCNYGVLLELAILLIIVYVPAFQPVFNTMNLEGRFWTPWFGSFFSLLALNEGRKYWTRKYPKGKIAKYLLW